LGDFQRWIIEHGCAAAVEPDRSVIAVEIAGRGYKYEARIGAGLLDEVGSTIASVLDRKRCALICDTKSAQLFAERASQSLTNAKFQPTVITIPAGEESKSLEQVGAICDEMIDAGLDRQSFVIGLGGGVVGDISGFVAAIFQRGVPHVQIPTTLLAMVDSSIGGKCGVNTRAGKNLLGAIHQPSLVIDDVDLLKTLPPHELRQGFAEVIKHGVIADADMFQKLDGFKPSSFEELVRRSVEIKANVVARDERDESGERAILNFGHTVGHAIERAGEYKKISHGDAISLGMIAAANISVKRAGLSEKERDAIVDLLRRFELPTKLPNEFSREQIFDAVTHDKKFEQGSVRFVVTPKIGSAFLSRDVTLDDIRASIDAL
jgi:3-dehydroquinate synthase